MEETDYKALEHPQEYILDKGGFIFVALYQDEPVGVSALCKLNNPDCFGRSDVVLCESPTYLAAISTLKAYGCRFIEIPTDADGMDMNVLEDVLNSTENIKLIYVIPTFQNPTGRTWSLERRRKLAELSAKYNIAVVEDNP